MSTFKNRYLSTFLVSLLVAITFAAPAHAGRYNISGKITRLLTIHDDIASNPYGGTKVYVDQYNVTAGSCPRMSTGEVIVWLRADATEGNDKVVNDRMFSMLLTAYVADESVNLRVDDAYKDANGVCILEFVEYLR